MVSEEVVPAFERHVAATVPGAGAGWSRKLARVSVACPGAFVLEVSVAARYTRLTAEY